MQVDRARNCFLDLHGKFSLSLSEILKKVVRLHQTRQMSGAVIGMEATSIYGDHRATFQETGSRPVLMMRVSS